MAGYEHACASQPRRAEQEQPQRTVAQNRDGIAGPHVRVVDAVQRTGQRLGEGRGVRVEPWWQRVEIALHDVSRDQGILGIGAIPEHQALAQALTLAPAEVAHPAGRRIGADYAHPRPPCEYLSAHRDDLAHVLMPERRGQLPQQDGMPTAIRLQVGAARRRDEDPNEDLARTRCGDRHVLDADITGAIKARRACGCGNRLDG